MLHPLLSYCCYWKCGDSILVTCMRTWLVQILQFIKLLHCVMWVWDWSKVLLYGRWRSMISIYFGSSGGTSVLENELIYKVTVWVPSQSWQAIHILLSSPWPICCIPTHRIGYVTLQHTLLWVVEPSVLHVLAHISARVLEWVFCLSPFSHPLWHDMPSRSRKAVCWLQISQFCWIL